MLILCDRFPYLDTMHVIDKWGPGCLFYGHNTPEEIDDWELRLKKGERFAGIFLETPGNPLTQTADLPRIKKLSLEYNIPILIDETVGSWVNVDALKFADLTVTSLSKSFSGYCDVMAGWYVPLSLLRVLENPSLMTILSHHASIVLNPSSPHYSTLKSTLTRLYSDDIFPPEALILEQNSRNYPARAKLMSSNAESLADYLSAHPLVAKVNFPKWTNRQNFDHVRRLDGKFGMIMSVFFETKEDAVVFFDHLETAKGGSLGTNFTLSIAFATMAFGRSEKALMHARSYGVVEECVRVSVGLEDIGELRKTFGRALEKVGEARKARSRL